MRLAQLQILAILEGKIFLKKLGFKKKGFSPEISFYFPIFCLITMLELMSLAQIRILMFPEKLWPSKPEQLMINGITGQLVTLNQLQ